MPGQQGAASPLPPLPSSSSQSRRCLLTNNPRRQQDGAPGLPQPQKRPSGNRLGSAPAPGCVGGVGKGCTVWERLRPSSPLPSLNIFSVGCSAGLPNPKCPLPWGVVCSTSVPSKWCCDTAPKSRARPHCLLAPVTSLDIVLQHPQQLSVPQVHWKGILGRVPSSCHYSSQDSWARGRMGGIQDLAGNSMRAMAARKGRVSATNGRSVITRQPRPLCLLLHGHTSQGRSSQAAPSWCCFYLSY